MNEKRYLKWHNKVGYGSGDIAGNVVYAFLSSFVMIYLTNTVGLNPGIIGTLIAVSKLFDGITDVFFGTMIDKTKSKMGKARPWMLYGYIGCAVTICATYILQQIYTAMLNMGIYYMTYILFNEKLYGVFSWAINIPLIIALLITPVLVEKWKGMYKLNLTGYVIGTIGRALVVVAGYLGSVPLMLLFTGIAAFGMGPWQGDMNAVIASCSEYTYLTKHKRVDGTMYSCTSLGIKLGGGIGIALTGWLLDFSGFDGTLAV